MDGYKETSDEKRFDALLMISDPTNMALMPPEPWKGVRIPTFISTGTNDFSDVGSGRMSAPFTYQIPENLLQSSSPHHFVLIEGADHYMGGLICRSDVPGPFQNEQLQISSNMSVVFLYAYVKKNQLLQISFVHLCMIGIPQVSDLSWLNLNSWTLTISIR